MSEYGDVINESFGLPRQAARVDAVTSLEDDPEKASRAMQLEEATGIPAPVIYGDQENFEREHKAILTSRMLEANPHLNDYIASNPMAAKVSNDDLGQLDIVSQKTSMFRNDSALGKIFEAAKTGYGEDPAMLKTSELDSPHLKAVLDTVWSAAMPQDTAFRLFNAAIYAGATAIGEGYKQFGGNEAMADRLTRDLIIAPQVMLPEFMKPGVPHELNTLAKQAKKAPDIKAQIDRVQKTIDVAQPWIEAGEEPPVGLHEALDELKGKQAKLDIDNLSEALKESQASKTRERNPKLFADFIRQHTDGEIGVSADAVLKLYGDKRPHPEDGILGWLPDIDKQLETAVATGGDIKIPLADWLANVDPVVTKELKDDLRARPGGVTLNEVKEASDRKALEAEREKEEAIPGVRPSIDAYHGSPHEFDAFSMEKIGTGEGAQSYGHGLYFAENPAVGKQYQHNLARGNRITTDVGAGGFNDSDIAKQLVGKDDVNVIYPVQLALTNMRMRGLDLETAIKNIREEYAHFPKESVDEAEAILRKANPRVVTEGSLYRVRINAEKEHFLDWDKPLSGQHPNVQQALSGLDEHIKVGWWPSLKNELQDIRRQQLKEAKTGQDLVSALERGTSKKDASRILKEAGIPGIKYLDQHSRPMYEDLAKVEAELKQIRKAIAIVEEQTTSPTQPMRLEQLKADEARLAANVEAAKNPTSNFVLFDDSLIQVLDRNGQAIAGVRAAAGLGPIERWMPQGRVMLEKTEKGIDIGISRISGVTNFMIRDEVGNRLGDLSVFPTKDQKDLHIGWIGGTGLNTEGGTTHVLGTKHIRDILRQLKEFFPAAETISGDRVSGAREKAGFQSSIVKVPIRASEAYDLFNDMVGKDHFELDEGQSFTVQNEVGDKAHTFNSIGSSTVKQSLSEVKFQSPNLTALRRFTDVITDAINKYAGDTPVHVVSDADFAKLGFDSSHTKGIYDQLHHAIVFPESTFDSSNLPYFLLHESIHAATSRVLDASPKLMDKVSSLMLEILNKQPNLKDEYGFTNEHEFLAEAISNPNFQDILHNTDISPELAKDLGITKKKGTAWDALIAWMRNVLKLPEEVTTALEAALRITEEVTSTKLRKGVEEQHTEWQKQISRAAVEPGQEAIFTKANALGMTVDAYRRYQRLMEKQNQEDMAWQYKKALEEEKRQQTTEWKANEKVVREEVEGGLGTNPQINALRYFVSGVLEGQEYKTPRIGEKYLTPEQKAMIPSHFVTKTGLHPDDLASVLGIDSGEQLLTYLAGAGAEPAKTVQAMMKSQVAGEMQKRYGKLDENILQEAKEHVVSMTQLDMLHEETVALGTKAGGEAPISKEDFKAWVKQNFSKLPSKQATMQAFLDNAGKAGRAAEMALLKEDYAEAFRQKQLQFSSMLHANEAKKFEKEQASFEKTAKRFSSREVRGIDPSYTNFIHDMLIRVGQPVKRSIQDLQNAIGHGVYATLEDFVDAKQGELRELPVADFLIDPSFRKPIESMTVEEARAIHDSIKAMVQNGRNELQIFKAGEAADLAEVKGQMLAQLEDLRKDKKYDPSMTKGQRILHGVRTYGVAHLQMEALLNRLDHGEPNGVFTQYVMRGLASAANTEAVLERKYSRMYSELKDKTDLTTKVENPLFRDPLSRSKTNPDGDLLQLNRGHLRAIMQNIGNASNLEKLAKGYHLEPDNIMAWINRVAKKEDWDFVQKQGDIFKEIKKESDRMYRELTGVEPEQVEIRPIDTPHGQYDGWYHPVIYHSVWQGTSKKLMGGPAEIEGQGYFRATTPAGYTKSRTGYTAPLSMDFDQVPSRMKQMLHDIAFRPEIINASKIFYDHDIQQAFTKHVGLAERNMLVPYLKDVANSSNFNSEAASLGARTSEFIRQNVIAALIGLNPGTVMKHGPTAAINSITEIGLGKFGKEVSVEGAQYAKHLYLKAFHGLFGGDEQIGNTNWRFAMDNSEELSRRHRHYIETLRGSSENVFKERSWRDTMIAIGSWPVATSDLLSAVPTWMAKYEMEMKDGASHGDAVFMADRAVRRAHGSSVITNRPAVMRGGPMAQWFASLYGFFSHIMNRQYELLWKAGDTMDLVKQGEYAEAAKKVPQLTWMFMSYIVLPALIEEMVTPLTNDEKESWGKFAGKTLAKGMSSSWVGVRDLVSGALTGHDPAAGLLSTAAKTVTDVYRDLAKDRPLSKQKAGQILQHGTTLFGALTGLTNAQEGKSARFIYDYTVGNVKPKGWHQWWHGLRYGTMEKKK